MSVIHKAYSGFLPFDIRNLGEGGFQSSAFQLPIQQICQLFWRAKTAQIAASISYSYNVDAGNFDNGTMSFSGSAPSSGNSTQMLFTPEQRAYWNFYTVSDYLIDDAYATIVAGSSKYNGGPTNPYSGPGSMQIVCLGPLTFPPVSVGAIQGFVTVDSLTNEYFTASTFFGGITPSGNLSWTVALSTNQDIGGGGTISGASYVIKIAGVTVATLPIYTSLVDPLLIAVAGSVVVNFDTFYPQ